MKKFIETMDNFSMVIKIILALPFLDIIWTIYRIVKSLDKQNYVGVLLGVLMIFIGIPFLWIIDIIFIVLKGNVFWID